MRVKQVPNHPDYLVSKNGDVFSKKFGKIKKLKPRKAYWGYFNVSICENGKASNKAIHRLVLMAFDRMPKPHEVARHFPDRNPANNHISNLRWGTHKENAHDKYHLHKTGNNPRNEDNGSCKLSNKQVIEIRRIYKQGNITKRKLGKKYKVSGCQIGCIVRNKSRILQKKLDI